MCCKNKRVLTASAGPEAVKRNVGVMEAVPQTVMPAFHASGFDQKAVDTSCEWNGDRPFSYLMRRKRPDSLFAKSFKPILLRIVLLSGRLRDATDQDAKGSGTNPLKTHRLHPEFPR
jgi:hypothetical protein